MQQRRALLHGGHYEIRPPWAISPEAFFNTCNHCNACIEICPTTIIECDRFQFPLLNFSKGECLFCRKCVEACPTEALTPTPKPWDHKAEIKGSCLSLHGIICQLCREVCEPQAIIFKPEHGGMTPPRINDLCTGCGACIAICPVQALFII